jgi:hypothetical protein
MSQERPRNKKIPMHLEDITDSLSVEGPNQEGEDLFSTNLFMGRYDEKQIMEKLEKVGIISILQEKGFRDLMVSIHKQDDYTSRLYVNFETLEKNTRLIEVIVREGIFRPKENFIPSYDFTGGLSMLLIEWLALQDPRAEFAADKPRLPGQQYPGLGGLKNMQEFLYKLGRSSGKDAIIDIPQYFHAAAIYSRLYSEIYSVTYSFFSPIDAGMMQALQRDLKGRPLSDISFAVALDCLVNVKIGKPVKWRPSEQVYPISKKLKRYVEDDRYKQIALRTMNEHSFSIDWDKYERLKEQGLLDEV